MSKVLYVINHIDWFWSHRLPLAKGAQDQSHTVHVAVTGASNDPQLTQKGFTGHETPSGNPIKTITTLHRIIKTEKPDIIHAITLKYALLTALAARNQPGTKVIHTIAGLGYLFSGEGLKPKLLRLILLPVFKRTFKNTRTKLIFQNPDDQALFLKRGLANETQCHLIRGSGVDTTQFPHTPEPKTDTPIILMPTRLVIEKGIATFIEATKILQSKGIKAKYQIAGGISTSNPNAITEPQMHQMLNGSPVEWLGKVTNMPALYQSASLIVYPSYYGEGIPKVLLEAASTGRAIITTNHPGCREAVTDGENGLLVPVKDPQALANAIETLLNDPKMRLKMGQNSRKKAEEEFAVERIVEQTLRLYS